MTDAASLATAAPVARTQPTGLYTLFFTEMWERFSYYGMRALLVLYLVHALGYARGDALHLYAVYTGLVYLTPILGGYIADRWLGTRRAVLVGAMVMALGHFAMAVPALLHLALGLLIAGNGFFKPNISTLVGSLYMPDDARRDSGFTIFYMGINLGAFLSPLVCGTLGEKFGWHYGFATAGVGMLAGLTVFVTGQGALRAASGHALRKRDWLIAFAVTATAVAAVAFAVYLGPSLYTAWQHLDPIARTALAVALVLLALRPFLRGVMGPALTRAEFERLAAIVILAAFVVFFWTGFEQAGGTMNLFADNLTDRMIFGWEMPASYFQSVNPLTIIVLAPFFAWLWSRWNRSRYALSTPAKMALGLLILGLAFVVLALGQGRADVIGRVSPLWLVSVYVLQTIGELFLSPIGLAMVTRVAPQRLVALAMGVWLAADSLASYLAGTLESLLHGTGIPLYWFLVASSVGAGLVLLLLTPFIRRLMRGVV